MILLLKNRLWKDSLLFSSETLTYALYITNTPTVLCALSPKSEFFIWRGGGGGGGPIRLPLSEFEML